MGKVDVRVKYCGQTATLPLVIVKGKGQALLGRDWMSVICTDWTKIHYTPGSGLQDLLARFNVLCEGLGTFQGLQARIEVDPYQGRQAWIEVDPSAKPRYCKARML